MKAIDDKLDLIIKYIEQLYPSKYNWVRKENLNKLSNSDLRTLQWELSNVAKSLSGKYKNGSSTVPSHVIEASIRKVEGYLNSIK